MKPIPNEQPGKKIKKKMQKNRAILVTNYPHLQKKQSIQDKNEQKIIQSLGQKLIKYAKGFSSITVKNVEELIHDTQKSLICLQKHQRRIIIRKRKKTK
jgi:hypothetical protein